MKLKTKIFLLIFSITIIILVLIINYVVFEILPYSPIKPNKLKSIDIINNPQNYTPDKFGFKFINLDFKSNDSLNLKAYLLLAEKPIANLILLHGIADNKESTYQFCKFLIQNNINCVITDLRAHGQSEGDFCTFGYKEKFDIQNLVKKIKEKDSLNIIGIFGASLGGAIALQTMALDTNIKFGIIESTFHRLDKVILEYSEDLLQFKSTYLVNNILTKSGEIADFKPFLVNPYISCKDINYPMFFAHGTIDDKIPLSFNLINYKNIKSKEKEFHKIKNAGHFDLQTKGGNEYYYKIINFINKVKNKI